MSRIVARHHRTERGNQTAAAFKEHRPHRHHPNAGDWLTRLIENPPGDQAHSGQREIDVIRQLAIGQLQLLAELEGAPLAIAQLQVAAARDRDGVAAGRQFLDLVASIGIGAGAARLAAKLWCLDRDPCAAQRFVRIGGKDLPRMMAVPVAAGRASRVGTPSGPAAAASSAAASGSRSEPSAAATRRPRTGEPSLPPEIHRHPDRHFDRNTPHSRRFAPPVPDNNFSGGRQIGVNRFDNAQATDRPVDV